MDRVEVGGLQIAYERVGRGSPLVLLHGFVGDGPTTWRTQLDGLSDAFTVVAWDAPGAGRSSDPPEDFVRREALALQRFRQVLALSEGTPGAFVGALLPTSSRRRAAWTLDAFGDATATATSEHR